MNSPSTSQLPPFRLACAFFSLGLVWARLLPVEKLCPLGSYQYAEFLPGPLHGVGHNVVSRGHDNVLVSLEQATRCDLFTLQEHCSLLGSEISHWTKGHSVPTAAKFQAASYHGGSHAVTSI